MTETGAVLLILAAALFFMLLSALFRILLFLKKRPEKTRHSVRNDWSEIPDPESVKGPENIRNSKISLALAGTGPRAGTTTQALQLALFLYYDREDGKTAYVEMNGTGFMDALADSYLGVRTYPDGRMEYRHLTMVRQKDIAAVMGPEYRYLIYDCGAVTDPEFQPGAFLDKEVRILSAGSKPQELEELQAVLGTGLDEGCSLLFSFVPEDDEEALLKSLGKEAGRSWFAAWQPDPFVSNPHMDVIYRRFVPEEKDV